MSTAWLVIVAVSALAMSGCTASDPWTREPVPDSIESTATRSITPVSTPSTTQPAGSPLANEFAWYRSAYPATGSLRVCAPDFPVPPNTLDSNGLCVRYRIFGVLGVQRREWVLYRETAVVASGGEWVDFGRFPTPAGLVETGVFGVLEAGRYRFVVSIDDRMAGSAEVDVP